MNTYTQTGDDIVSKGNPSEGLGGLLLKYDLDKFRVFKSKTLFEPTREDLVQWLSQMKCPLCYRKLYWNLKGDKAFCRSKVKDGFFIRKEVLEKFL